MPLKRLICLASMLLLCALTAAAQQLPEHFIPLYPDTVYAGELDEREARYFYFTLQHTADVVLESRTSTSRTNNVYPEGTLYHLDGRVIARNWSGGQGRNFRIARRLEAGTYVLKVEDARGCGSLHGCPEIQRGFQLLFNLTEPLPF